MVTPLPFETAASHHLTGHPAYASRLIERVAGLCRLRDTDRVLDVGCGPGQLAVALAPLAGEVVALDPEPEMLRHAAIAAAEVGGKVTFMNGSPYDLAPSLGRFHLVVIGPAFHWMDRVETLRRLDMMIEPDGALALFDDSHPMVPDNAWLADYRAIVDRFSSDDPHHRLHRAPDWIRHEAVLLDSSFSQLETVGVIERRRTPVDSLVDRALSMSSASRGGIGALADDLAQAIREAMTVHAHNGAIVEVIETEALVAHRPPPAPP